jgi:hypothetical protein
MGKPFEPYVEVEVESFRPNSTAGRHGPIHIRPVAGQGYSPDIVVRCPKEMSYDYPVGTRFLIKAKHTDRGGSGDFLSAPHQWPFKVLTKPKRKT